MKRLTIINKAQFGYHTDTFKYCEYLRGQFAVTYYCFDQRLAKIELPGIRVIYISSSGGFMKRGFRFLNELRKQPDFRTDIAFVVDFQLAFLAFLFVKSRNYILDIRTASVSGSKNKRRIQNASTRFNAFFFKQVTVISEGVARKLGLRKYTLLPLGADRISVEDHPMDTLKLLYVGTFTNRRIYDTIEGFGLFRTAHPEVSAEYHLIGFGIPEEEQRLLEAIERSAFKSSIHFHGKVFREALVPYFNTCNIGISYVPMTDYYDHQPPTKTFEYLLSGMVCIATETTENKRIIREENGVTCLDNPQAFAEALATVAKQRDRFDSKAIREAAEPFTWKAILSDQLIPYLNNLA